MTFSSLTLAALTSFLATASIPQPNWQTDYAKARALSVELKKPVAVFLANGGSEKLVAGGIGDDAVKVLKQSYVCLSIDTSTPAGKDLASAFKMTEGLVISDKTGGVQALRHEGSVTKTQLAGYLERYSAVNTVNTTESRSNYTPVYGGCANGRCGVVYQSIGGCANGQCGR